MFNWEGIPVKAYEGERNSTLSLSWTNGAPQEVLCFRPESITRIKPAGFLRHEPPGHNPAASSVTTC